MKTENIYTKLHLCKTQIGTITKDSKNPFFKSNYLSLNGLLDAIEPVLSENGLLILQPLKDGCVCTEIVETESGEKVTSLIQLPNITDPQKLGSAITYFRRYTLESLLGLKADDDDGNHASKPTTKKVELTADQFQNLLKPENKKHIQTYLDKHTMSVEQNKVLTQLAK
tara:strand:+ start:178 stop:684 length:507 start_codon:yes stop_codon:yes gene_type:complete